MASANRSRIGDGMPEATNGTLASPGIAIELCALQALIDLHIVVALIHSGARTRGSIGIIIVTVEETIFVAIAVAVVVIFVIFFCLERCMLGRTAPTPTTIPAPETHLDLRPHTQELDVPGKSFPCNITSIKGFFNIGRGAKVHVMDKQAERIRIGYREIYRGVRRRRREQTRKKRGYGQATGRGR